nr:ShlB/FhaC/HecB family hemolysin secretion/activation protein [Burkholderia diffusa]
MELSGQPQHERHHEWFAYGGTLGGQYTNVAFYGSEQLYLGGMDTIRGFRSGRSQETAAFTRATSSHG